MCGIVGYIGKEQAAPILIEGLSRLEYRGYDSAGVAVFDAESGSYTFAYYRPCMYRCKEQRKVLLARKERTEIMRRMKL